MLHNCVRGCVCVCDGVCESKTIFSLAIRIPVNYSLNEDSHMHEYYFPFIPKMKGRKIERRSNGRGISKKKIKKFVIKRIIFAVLKH